MLYNRTHVLKRPVSIMIEVDSGKYKQGSCFLILVQDFMKRKIQKYVLLFTESPSPYFNIDMTHGFQMGVLVVNFLMFLGKIYLHLYKVKN